MNSLDDLSFSVSPLDSASLNQVDGGLWPLIVVLAGFDVGLWGYIALRD